jgi:hypothetical protein
MIWVICRQILGCGHPSRSSTAGITSWSMVTGCLLPKSELIFICCWCLSLHRMGLLPDLTMDNAANLHAWSYVIGALLYPRSTGRGGGYTVLPLSVRSSQDVHNICLGNYLWQQSDINIKRQNYIKVPGKNLVRQTCVNSVPVWFHSYK